MVHEVPRCGPEEDAALDRIEEVRRGLRFHTATPRRWVGSVRRILSARAIQGSNSIEGHDVSVDDAVAAVQGGEPVSASSADWQAVVGYRRAMTYVLQLAHDAHFELSPGLLRSLHFMMTEDDLDAGPGLWRPGAIWVRNDATGEVVYEAPDADLVPGLVEQVVAQVTATDTEAPSLVRAAMAHLNLVMVHPFRDGNGRMARCLQTLVLARDGLLAPEFCSIEEFLGANTQGYYDVLAQVGRGRWSPSNDARPWVRYCLAAHYVQAVSVLRRVRESEQVWGELEDLAAELRLPERSVAGLFDATMGLSLRNSSYRATVRQEWDETISNQVATTDLRAMVRAGLLEQNGKKRGTFYVRAGALLEIRGRLVKGRQEIDVSGLFDPAEPTATEAARQ